MVLLWTAFKSEELADDLEYIKNSRELARILNAGE
jgi:hypothetical protein